MNRQSIRKSVSAEFVHVGLTVICAGFFGVSVLGQGVITFSGASGFAGTNYDELGMGFQVIIPLGTSGHDDMGITLGAGNTPRNGTAFMGWARLHNPSDFVELSLNNGNTFGLTSVDLADPNSPSLSPVPISFIGYLAGGSFVTNTFTTPGGGATTFAAYTFNSDFTSGLTSVDILAPRWAMDNLVFSVPEPGVGSLITVGLLAFAARKSQTSRKSMW